MTTKRVSIFFVLISGYGVLVNFVTANTPSQMEPSPLYPHAATFPAAHNVVNYNASPNPQYSVQPPSLPQMPGNYQNMDYQQNPPQRLKQKKSLEELVTGSSTTAAPYDYTSDLKNTLVTMKDNLGFMADTQRLLLNSFQAQQQQFNNIEEKLEKNDSDFQRNAAYGAQPTYGPALPPQPQYQLILPPLPPLPYGQSTHEEKKEHHHKKHSHKKSLKKHRRGSTRGLALLQRRSESARLERHAAMTLAYLKNGIVNALWTAAVVACVKLAPILLFGFKLMFKSVLPLTGLALFGANRGLFPQQLKKDDNNEDNSDIRFDEVDDDDDDEDITDESEDEDRDNSEEKDKNSHHYR